LLSAPPVAVKTVAKLVEQSQGKSRITRPEVVVLGTESLGESTEQPPFCVNQPCGVLS
jgi:hypothetical protein